MTKPTGRGRKNINVSENNGQWKGDAVGYEALHAWVKRRYFHSDKCDNCGKPCIPDLANKSGEYKRDLTDWNYLCRKCHMESDGRLVALIKSRLPVNGELNPAARLKNEDVPSIYISWASGKPVKEIAVDFGVSVSAIEGVIYNNTFLDVPRPDVARSVESFICLMCPKSTRSKDKLCKVHRNLQLSRLSRGRIKSLSDLGFHAKR